MKLINKLVVFLLVPIFCLAFSDQITGDKITRAKKLNENSKSVLDFKIEGISIYDDAINYFSKKTIIGYNQYDEASAYTTYDILGDFKKYYGIQITAKKNDKKNFKIYGISGAIIYGQQGIPNSENFKKCEQDYNSILKVFDNEFSKYKIGTFDEHGDNKGIKRRLKTIYEFDDESMIFLFCVIHGDKKKKKENLWDSMRVSLMSKEVVKTIKKKYGKNALYN